MVHHHGAIAPDMGPVRDDDDAWARRRAHYERRLARPAGPSCSSRATRAARSATRSSRRGPVAHLAGAGRLGGEIDSLSVLPEARGTGLGERLVARVQEEVGDRELRLYAVAANADALRFYERLGFVTSLVVMRRPR